MQVIIKHNGYQYMMHPKAKELGCKKYDGNYIPNDTICKAVKINRFKNKATIVCVYFEGMYYLIEACGIEIYSL